MYPFYISLIEKYKKSPYYCGKMSDFLDVNPKTDCSMLTDKTEVSFVPMPNVQERNNMVSYDMVPYEKVKKGFTVFRRDDLIWAKITPCMQNGKSCIVDEMPTEIGFGSTEFHVVRKRNDDVYMPFIWSIFSNENVLKAAQAVFSGSAGQQRVSESFLKMFPAVLPKYNDQVRFVANLEKKLESMNDRLGQAEKLFADMSKYMHSILGIGEVSVQKSVAFAINSHMTFGARIDPEYHNPYYTHRVKEIEKLAYDTLGNIIEFSTEAWDQKAIFYDSFPYIEISGVKIRENSYRTTDVAVSAAPSRAKMIVRNGDIIVSTTRPHRGAIATISCDEDDIQIASTGFCVLRKLKRKDVLKEYLQWILLDDYVLLQMLQRSSGGNYPAITSDELKQIVIPIPDLNAQQKICIEARRRKQEADNLRLDAEREWKAAKAQFEKELLGE